MTDYLEEALEKYFQDEDNGIEFDNGIYGRTINKCSVIFNMDEDLKNELLELPLKENFSLVDLSDLMTRYQKDYHLTLASMLTEAIQDFIE